MDRELSQTEIKEFIASNGLDTDPLDERDERDETLESWRLKWEGLAKGFLNYLQDRFASIEQRLERLEEERYGHQTD
jgi:predicted metal-dependent peptidase